MVADLESSTHRSFKFPSTPTRWDLKNRKSFPQWHTDLRRVVKYVTSPAFLGSSPPPFNVASTAGPSTRSTARSSSTSSASHAHACAPTPAQEEWLKHNILLYDIMMASVTLSEDQLVHVETAFGKVSDGNALYDWVISHADDTSLSAQIVLKQSLKKLTISDVASAEEVDDVFAVIQVTWPKIAAYDNSSSSPMIEYALSLFPAGYVHKYYLAAIQMHQDGGGRWATFAAFRKEVVERLKIIEIRDGPPASAPAAFSAAQGQTGAKRMHASTCGKCDISFCDGKDCIVFNTAAVKATGSAKRLVHYLRMYAKEKHLTNMKGVTPPDGRLVHHLSPLEKAKLDHCRKGHVSLRRAVVSAKHSTGGLSLTKDAVQQLAAEGCDICNAYKIKLRDPKSKDPDPAQDASDAVLDVLIYDSFGKVSEPSAQHGYHHAHLYLSKPKGIGWIPGSVDLSESTVQALHASMLSNFRAWFPNETVRIFRADSFSTNRSKSIVQWFEAGMTSCQFTPPGQHAFLEVERLWYPLLTGALVAMRHGRAPKNQWFNAMRHQLDVECTLVSREATSDGDKTTAYERATGRVPDVSDVYCFYAPGRFALDPAARPDKWMERARAVTVGRHSWSPRMPPPCGSRSTSFAASCTCGRRWLKAKLISSHAQVAQTRQTLSQSTCERRCSSRLAASGWERDEGRRDGSHRVKRPRGWIQTARSRACMHTPPRLAARGETFFGVSCESAAEKGSDGCPSAKLGVRPITVLGPFEASPRSLPELRQANQRRSDESAAALSCSCRNGFSWV